MLRIHQQRCVLKLEASSVDVDDVADPVDLESVGLAVQKSCHTGTKGSVNAKQTVAAAITEVQKCASAVLPARTYHRVTPYTRACAGALTTCRFDAMIAIELV